MPDEPKARGVTVYFQRVQWLHEHADEPVVLWAHVVDGWEVRKVDEFRDGHLSWADADHESESTCLGTIPVPPPTGIAEDPQFVVDVVDSAEFEYIWRRARQDGTA
ncbi:DUF6881 domain-containing protein [Promicromonospora soli]|uniref:DUF6881 domain-containing protein n=1 Tax=Promicromonospora soli TaxID=2035533 RepID=A0A919FPW9_9MICO|nr:hypothetical protein [Promicromonospora soli]GHH70357.1 hypothetical protein GCM10017772_16850 [Promicromonospora soli]